MNFVAPSEVPQPQVKGYRKHSVILEFDRANEENGDLSYYYLVVVPQKVASQKSPQDFKEEEVNFKKRLCVMQRFMGKCLMQ
jgi:hypothetical protein